MTQKADVFRFVLAFVAGFVAVLVFHQGLLALLIVTLLSHYSGLPTAFVRKEAKKYGTSRLAEGAEINNRKVLIVEDVVTSGGQIVISANQLRQLGAQIDYVVCVIDREEGAIDKLLAEGITMLSLLKRRDLPI